MQASDDDETTQVNMESQNDELSVLQSIYEEEFYNRADQHCYEVNIVLNELIPPLILQFWFSENYPSHNPPNFRAKSPWLTKAHISALDTSLQQLFVPGEPVMYQWIEWIKANAFEEFQLSDVVQLHRSEQDSSGDENAHVHDMHPEEELDPEVTQEIKQLNIVHGEIFVEKKSRFVGHVASVTSLKQVNEFIRELKRDKRVAEATHNIVAYRFETKSPVNGETIIAEDRDDDGETGAGDPMLFLLQRANAINVCVVVTRWYGGIQLGADRFRIITNVAKELLQATGYIKTAKKR